MNEKTYHIITGLPRSGSTLLSCLLNQNPRFYSSITSPVFDIYKGIINRGPQDFGVTSDFPMEKRKRVIQGLFDSYYDDVDAQVIFNTNRGWLIDLHNIKYVFPRTKYIVCVRSILEILNSFEVALRQAPLMKSSMFKHGPASYISSDVYSRTAYLMNDGSDGGELGQVFGVYTSLKQAAYSAEVGEMLFIEYESLCTHPEGIMESVYSFIDEPYFDHDYNNVTSDFDKWDDVIGIPLHRVRSKIEYSPPKMILPPDIVERYSEIEFWRT